MIAQGRHVTPSIESNPLTACTRIGIQRFFEAAEGNIKDIFYSKIQSLKQLRYKVEIHNCALNRGSAHRRAPPPSARAARALCAPLGGPNYDMWIALDALGRGQNFQPRDRHRLGAPSQGLAEVELALHLMICSHL